MKLLAFIFLIAFGLQACAPKPQEDCGFVQNSYHERISWRNQIPVRMYIHESVSDDNMAAIVSAAKVWQDATGKPLFEIVTDHKIAGPINSKKDAQNVIYYMNPWNGDPAEQAVTSIRSVGNQITDADIRINGQYSYYWNPPGTFRNYYGSINIEALMIHELGHVLGLAHKDIAGSVMNPRLPNNTDRVTIIDTDKISLRCEY